MQWKIIGRVHVAIHKPPCSENNFSSQQKISPVNFTITLFSFIVPVMLHAYTVAF